MSALTAAVHAVVIIILARQARAAEPTATAESTARVSTAQPRWEIGLVGGAAAVPHYPGSSQSQARWLAFPYVRYRGDRVRADQQGGLRARLFGSRAASIELGFAGSFPASSQTNQARAGMPDLRWLGELGPRVVVPLGNLNGAGSLNARLPVRAALSTDFRSLSLEGWTFAPQLALTLEPLTFLKERLTSYLTLNFVTPGLARYFYEIAPTYASAGRPAYSARGGYFGTDWFAGVFLPVGRELSLFLGTRLSFYGGATNVDSPLHRDDYAMTGIVGLSWRVFESRQKVADVVPF